MFIIIFQTELNVDSSGIGLAICKQIIQQHGGEIWAESVEKEGAKFIFTLPIK